MEPEFVNHPSWLSLIRRYGMFTMAANLAWESAHLPLYTIWNDGTPRDLAVAVLHCTAGDLVIACFCLISAIVFLGCQDWPTRRYTVVAIGATAFGVAYTIYSERMNLEGGGWAYSNAMPIVPPFGIGLSPLLQWLVVPPVGLAVARRVLPAAGSQPRDQAGPRPAGD